MIRRASPAGLSRRSLFKSVAGLFLATIASDAASASTGRKVIVSVRGADVTAEGLQIGPARMLFIRVGTPAWDAWVAHSGEMPRAASANGIGWWRPALFPPPKRQGLQAAPPCGSKADSRELGRQASPTLRMPDTEALRSDHLMAEGPSEGPVQ